MVACLGGVKRRIKIKKVRVIYVAIGRPPSAAGGMVKDPHAAGLGPGRTDARPAAALSGQGGGLG